MADPDELARTATAAASGPSEPAPELGQTLGRYRLEKTLGEGGMGVVHAAFDPDLERRVALKVLRKIDASGDARQRLLREARAMARLTHENVVVVHEVGTAGDRDYVAMELIDGENLADWLAEPREVHEIVDAFVSAGRGLAAAHAAGLVHRDFKPHNVLRRRDGKIVVTDFGLARGVEDVPGVALQETMDLKAPAGSQPSGLSGITKTGSVLGTPAYMAPEQWTGGTVGPPADQFAFCVALWEALTGARPFKGETLDELKASVKRGPAELDASKLPRRLRRTLVRGLDQDSTKRWPSMTALLGSVRRADRHVGVALMLAGGALVAGGIALFAMHRGSTCDPPAIDPSQVWQEAFGKNMPPELSSLFNAQITHWAVARATACTADPLAKQVQLHCLDGALERLDVIRQAFAAVPGATSDDAAGELVNPSICLGPSAPRLGFPHSADAIKAYTFYAQGTVDPKAHSAEALAFANRPSIDNCSKAVALVAGMKSLKDFQSRRQTVMDAVAAAEQCDDDRTRADVLVVAAPLQFEEPMIGPRGMEAIKKADSAIQRVSEPQLFARLASMRARVAQQQGHGKEALALADHAVEVYQSNNQIRYAMKAAQTAINMRFLVGGMTRKEVPSIVERWLPVAKSMDVTDSIHAFERASAVYRWLNGDPTAHGDLVKLWKEQKPHDPPHPIEGDVVDREGKPVIGAVVAAAPVLLADSVGVPFPFYYEDDDARGTLHTTITDDHGHFKFIDAATTGAMMAQLGDRRSTPVKIEDHTRLVLEPTRRLSGKVALGDTMNSDCVIILANPNDKTNTTQYMAAVAPDGTFVVDGAPQTAVKLGIGVAHSDTAAQLEFQNIPASNEPITGIAVKVPKSARSLDVLARSTYAQPLEAAQVVLVPGKVQLATVGDLLANNSAGLNVQIARSVTGEALPKEAAGLYRKGDLIAQFENLPAGDVTACAIGLPSDLQDEALLSKMQKHRAELEMRCTTVGDDTKTIVISTPPTKNLD